MRLVRRLHARYLFTIELHFPDIDRTHEIGNLWFRSQALAFASRAARGLEMGEVVVLANEPRREIARYPPGGRRRGWWRS